MKQIKKDKIRFFAILVLTAFIIGITTVFSYRSFVQGDKIGGIVTILLSLLILGMIVFVFRKGNSDLKKGYPLQDERSKRVMEKATSKAFYVSLYALLLIGFLSDEIIQFKDTSQALNLVVGIMGLLFLGFWIYYHNKEI
ncbi:MAG: DUF2178 domain-containing protein [Candidatus Woesearchaeota archaeon]|jgi:uncharacterized membrane protein